MRTPFLHLIRLSLIALFGLLAPALKAQQTTVEPEPVKEAPPAVLQEPTHDPLTAPAPKVVAGRKPRVQRVPMSGVAPAPAEAPALRTAAPAAVPAAPAAVPAAAPKAPKAARNTRVEPVTNETH